jgi:GT2 family glycosyltransferase
MTAKTLSMSVCICTRDRPKELARLLSSIPSESEYIHEILVSDDGNDEETRVVVEEFGFVTWIAGPGRGVSANRNNVARCSRGTHVWFLDDDALVSSHCLEELVACLCDGERLKRRIVSGSVDDFGVLIEPHEQTFLGFQGIAYRPGDRRTTVVLGNAVFPRSLFDHIQFDESLRSVYEEVDFTTRAVTLGYEIVHCPTAVALHRQPQTARGYDRYGKEMNVARLYVTSKRRGFTEGRPDRAVAYLLIALPHLVLDRLVKGGIKTLPESISSIVEVFARLIGHARHQAQGTA